MLEIKELEGKNERTLVNSELANIVGGEIEPEGGANTKEGSNTTTRDTGKLDSEDAGGNSTTIAVSDHYDSTYWIFTDIYQN